MDWRVGNNADSALFFLALQALLALIYSGKKKRNQGENKWKPALRWPLRPASRL